MSARRATLLVMAKMALADGHLSEEETAFLTPLLGSDAELEQVVAEAKGRSLADLIAAVEPYADRFFIALRAASMARVDAVLDAREEALYEKLVGLLKIAPKDRAIIETAVRDLDAVEPQPPDPRIEELYRQSSFA